MWRKTGQLDVADLKAKTDDKLAALQTEATQKAVILTQQTEEKLATRITEAQQQAEQKAPQTRRSQSHRPNNGE